MLATLPPARLPMRATVRRPDITVDVQGIVGPDGARLIAAVDLPDATYWYVHTDGDTTTRSRHVATYAMDLAHDLAHHGTGPWRLVQRVPR